MVLEVALVFLELSSLAEGGGDREVVGLVLGEDREVEGGLAEVGVGVEVEGEVGQLG